MSMGPATRRPRLATAALTATLVWWMPEPVLARPGWSQQSPQQSQQGQEDERDQDEPRVETVVTVTATRLPYEPDEITASTRTVRADELRLRPGSGLDEALRWIPALSLFRRAPARAAHPTTHGVNLRGVAPSGTSRALVLVDGVPLSDAFGGWVQWDRVPMEALERVEVALGGGPAPFGNQSLAGTVQLVTRAPESAPALRMSARVGSDATWQSGAAASWTPGPIGLLAAGRATGTDGYVGVAPEQRGPVDSPLASRATSGFLKLELRSGWRLTVDGFSASRDNGTPLQTNRVAGYGGALALAPAPPGAEAGTSVTAFARHSGLDSVFTAVDADRGAETAVLEQDVDATDLGAVISAWSAPAPEIRIAFGAEARHARGTSREKVLLAGLTREPGGRQTVAGAWGSARLTPSESAWVLEASLRGDAWRQRPRLETDPGLTGSALSPRLGALWQGPGGWLLRASGYGSFRVPTLNELYRQFRVGDVITAANPQLQEEHLWGAEIGSVWAGRLGTTPVRVEASAYWSRLTDAVTNATLETRNGLVFRQRRNLGVARVRGLELDLQARPGRLSVGVAAALLDARILAGAAATGVDVVDNLLPQVPRWRLTASAGYLSPAGVTMMIGLHATGRQYEDDQNLLPLASGSTLDAALDWPLGGVTSLGVYAQNLLDSRLDVARTPILVLGPPRSVSIGITLEPE